MRQLKLYRCLCAHHRALASIVPLPDDPISGRLPKMVTILDVRLTPWRLKIDAELTYDSAVPAGLLGARFPYSRYVSSGNRLWETVLTLGLIRRVGVYEEQGRILCHSSFNWTL